MYVYCAYMYSLYLCVHCFSVYRYVYSCACVLFDHATVRRGALLFLAYLCTVFRSLFAACRFRFHLPFLCSRTFAVYGRALYSMFMRTFFAVPFAVRFAPKRLQRSFQTVLRRF